MDAKSVHEILLRKGVDAIIRTHPSADFNPDTNKATSLTPIDYPVKIMPPYRNREGYKPAELITSGKGLTGIANYNLQFEVKAGLRIIIGSKEWTVIGYTPVADNTGTLLYLFEIESGN